MGHGTTRINNKERYKNIKAIPGMRDNRFYVGGNLL